MKYNDLYRQHDSFSALMRMIDKSSISTLSYDSLSSFVFKITVADPSSYIPEFFSLNDEGNGFTKPVTQLVLKIVIIEEETKLYKTPFYKKSETYEKFENEAKTQQTIYRETLETTGKPICPGVVDLSFFDKNDSISFFRKLLDHTPDGDTTTQYILTDLISFFTPNNYNLGMISMELANDTRTLGYIENEYKNTAPPNKQKKKLYEYGLCMAVAEMLILFIEKKYINYDLHLGNVLVQTVEPYKIVFIDFGRTFILQFYPFLEEIKGQYNTLFHPAKYDADYTEISSLALSDLTHDNLNKIIRFIARIDYAMNKDTYGADIIKPQMIGILEGLYGGEANTEIFYMNPSKFKLLEQTKIYYDKIRAFISALKVVTVPLSEANILSLTDTPPYRGINEEYMKLVPEKSKSAIPIIKAQSMKAKAQSKKK